MTKQTYVIIVMYLYVMIGSLSLSAATDPSGIFLTGQNNTQIAVYQEHDSWQGKITASDNTKAQIGNIIIKDITLKGEDFMGKLYIAPKKRWVDCTLNPSAKELVINIELGRFKKQFAWLRYTDNETVE